MYLQYCLTICPICHIIVYSSEQHHIIAYHAAPTNVLCDRGGVVLVNYVEGGVTCILMVYYYVMYSDTGCI